MNHLEAELYDVTIIGGGPAGMYSAFYAGLREMKTKIVEVKNELGGFMRTYPEKLVWDVGGIEATRCENIIHSLINQAMTFEPTVVFEQEIVGLEKVEDGTFRLIAHNGEIHATRTVIIAAGRGITQIQKLTVEGAEKFELTNLHYTVTNKERFRNKNIVISGGGDSAVDWANELVKIAESVTVVHRRDVFSAMESPVAEMKETCNVKIPYVVNRLIGSQNNKITSVIIEHVENGEQETIDVDEVLVNHGFDRGHGPILEWGLEKEPYGLLVTPDMKTSMSGIFGAGDIVTNEGKIRLIAGAFNDAVLAVNSAKAYLDPDAMSMAGVSSHNDRLNDKNAALMKKWSSN